MDNNGAKSLNHKIALLVTGLLSCLLVAAAGYMFAYYTNDESIDNTMQTATSEMVLNEIFNPSDYWVPGETKQKEVSFENTGEVDQLLRFTVTETWYVEQVSEDGSVEWVEWTAAGTDLAEGKDPAAIGFTEELSEQWTLIDGYYYYNYVIAPETETDIVMDSVTFSDLLDNGGYGISLDYSDKRYSLVITMEAIEVNEEVALSSWGVYCMNNAGELTWSEDAIND